MRGGVVSPKRTAIIWISTRRQKRHNVSRPTQVLQGASRPALQRLPSGSAPAPAKMSQRQSWLSIRPLPSSTTRWSRYAPPLPLPTVESIRPLSSNVERITHGRSPRSPRYPPPDSRRLGSLQPE
eukprot:1195813-Prorocentrum_minimum.AAC.1